MKIRIYDFYADFFVFTFIVNWGKIMGAGGSYAFPLCALLRGRAFLRLAS
ncbi:MAG: hypothetical protein K2G04_02530 [Oscillospiraceae bacterium]|nr:hypothetical protein [Oscillospiraceae bacterium]